MPPLEAAMWGAIGGFVVEGLAFAAAIRRVGGWPWRWATEPQPLPYASMVLVRVAAGAGLAAPAGSSGQVSTAFAAFVLGVAAPLVVEKIVQTAAQQRLPNLTHEQVETPITGAASAQSALVQAGESDAT